MQKSLNSSTVKIRILCKTKAVQRNPNTMEWFMQIVEYLKTEWLFMSWRDIVELLFFISVSYYILRWLSKDKQKNLTLAFYGYVFLTAFSVYANIEGMALVLLVSAPIVMMLFIFIHQQTLQKNYISLKAAPLKKIASDKWLEELIQASLRGVNANKTIICVIERTQALNAFFTARCTFSAPITHELLTLLINTTQVEEDHITIWVTQSGILTAINPLWHAEYDEIWVSKEIKLLHKWKQDALFITQKSDALVTVLSAETRLFDVFVDGKRFDNISANYAFSLIKQLCIETSSSKGSSHASSTRKHNQQHPNM